MSTAAGILFPWSITYFDSLESSITSLESTMSWRLDIASWVDNATSKENRSSFLLSEHSVSVITYLVIAVFCIYLWLWRGAEQKRRGPRAFPIVGCLPQILWNASHLYDWTTSELKKTPTMTIHSKVPGIVYIETANPANVEHILKTNFENYPKGKHFRSLFKELLGVGIFNADGASWKQQRKVASPEFSRRTLRDFAMKAVVRELEDRLIPILDAVVDAELDLQALLLRFTFDTACQIAFGKDPGCLDDQFPFAQAFDDCVELSTLRSWGTFPPWQLKKLLNIGSERKLRESLKIVDAFAFDLIRDRRQESSDASDLLGRFMHFADEFVEVPEIKQQLADDPRSKHVAPSDLFLRDIVTGFLLAGRDTSATGLAWFFWLLSSHKEIESRILDEIATCTKTESSSFSFEDIRNMHYLHAALIETMRLHPPVPEDAKQAEADDIWPDGTRIQKGTVVSFHIYAMGRNESIWGSDFAEFRPERFLKNGVFSPRSPFEYPVFQGGPRMCLGVDMAMMQMKLVAATLLSRYEFVVREGYRAHYDLSLTMKILEGLPIRVRPSTFRVLECDDDDDENLVFYD